MKILYKNPFAMSDEDREAALKLLSGKRINIHAVERVDGASTAARLVRETAEHFGATQVNLGQKELNQDIFVSIHNGVSLPYQFWVGEGERSSQEMSQPRISIVEESNHEELTARILMAMCYFIQMKESGTPLPELSSSELGAATRGSSGCFVSTVCMGAFDHPKVKDLRRFRDEILIDTPLGRWFIKLYYIVGPRIAKWLSNHKIALSVVRVTLVLPAAKLARGLTNH